MYIKYIATSARKEPEFIYIIYGVLHREKCFALSQKGQRADTNSKIDREH